MLSASPSPDGRTDLAPPTMSAHVAEAARVMPDVGEGLSPSFGDAVWDFGPLIHRRNLKKSLTRIQWEQVPSQWRLLAREYLYARLNEEGPRTARMHPAGAVGALHLLRRFLRFCDEAGRALPELTQDDLDRFLREIQNNGVTPDRQVTYVSTVQHLFRVRERLTGRTLEVAPWRSGSPIKVVRSDENKTPRIPEAVMGPLLRLALFYVQTAALDVLAARTEINDLVARRRRWPDAAQRLSEWVRGREAEGRGLPALSPRASMRHRQGRADVNIKQCLLMAGLLSEAATPRMRQVLAEAAETLPLEPGGLDTAISLDPVTGLPWRERFDRQAVVAEERRLQAACYIVISYLSGMRDSEVQMLKRGCLSTERGEGGEVIRYRLEGRVYKDRGPKGDVAQWVVISEVADAVRVLERLADGDLLFARANYRQQSDVLGPAIVPMINDFRDHVAAMRPADAIPPVNGKPWHFVTKQFRRTVAWHIANQPFGEVAGARQYQHVRITTFQGYAGTSDSGFKAEVEQEEADRRERDILDLYEDYQRGAPATSAGAARLHRQFDDVAESSSDLPGRVVDERRRQAMLKAISSNYYAGVFNDCLLQEDTASCLTGQEAAPGRRLLPVLNLCAPTTCPNSTLLPKHAPAWSAQKDSLEHRLATPGLSPLQELSLRTQLDEVSGVLNGLADA